MIVYSESVFNYKCDFCQYPWSVRQINPDPLRPVCCPRCFKFSTIEEIAEIELPPNQAGSDTYDY